MVIDTKFAYLEPPIYVHVVYEYRDCLAHTITQMEQIQTAQ